MASVDLFDIVTIKKVCKPGYLKIITNCGFLPTDSRNIAHKAARLLIGKYGIETGFFISLEKQIPVSAGLGGGSANAAAVLLGIKKLLDLPIPFKELMKTGETLGADVPYCLSRGTCLAEGIGERLTGLNPMPRCWVFLARPPVAVSTAEIFRSLSLSGGPPCDKGFDELLRGIKNGDLAAICKNMRNSLEGVTSARYPDILRLKEIMAEFGALGALMSGSGPTVFGIFAERGRALRAMEAVKSRMSHVNELFVRLICREKHKNI
jgi:4-diphosphocytidyl-2-C-methyl-D-erythritol kinase